MAQQAMSFTAAEQKIIEDTVLRAKTARIGSVILVANRLNQAIVDKQPLPYSYDVAREIVRRLNALRG